jgi:hypothetical protein
MNLVWTDLGPTPQAGLPYYDVQSWGAGYRRGFSDGHASGEQLGEYAMRERLMKRLGDWGQDLKLGCFDVATPVETWREICLLVEECRLEPATPTDAKKECA